MKNIRIRSYAGLYFPAFELNTEQNNSEYGHFLLNISEAGLKLEQKQQCCTFYQSWLDK